MMTVYNVQLGSISASTLTSPATTLLVKEALTKGVFQPSLPSTTVHTTDGTVGHKARGPLNLGAGEGLELKEALEKGAKIKAISIWTYVAKEGSGETVGPTFGALSSPWSTSSLVTVLNGKEVYAWASLAIGKVEAEATTLANLAALELFLETSKAKTWFGAELYLSVEAEASGTPTEIKGISAATAASSTSLALRASTGIILGAAQANSAVLLALGAPTAVPVAAASATSAGSLALGAPTNLPTEAASAVSAGALSLAAATDVSPAPAAAISSAQLLLGAATAIPVAPALASSTGSLGLSAPAGLGLLAASAASAGSMLLGVTSNGEIIPVQAASASSSSTLALGAPTRIPTNAANATSSTALALAAYTLVTPQAVAVSSSATLALSALTEMGLLPAAAVSGAALTLDVSINGVPIPLGAATAVCTTTLALAAPTLLPLNPASSTSGASCTVTVIIVPLGEPIAVAWILQIRDVAPLVLAQPPEQNVILQQDTQPYFVLKTSD